MTSSDQDIAAVFATHGQATAGLPEDVVRLAHLLGRIHGDVLIASENKGYHLYMASPFLLEKDGRVELTKRHLAVNASRYFGLGEVYKDFSERRRDKCGLCMKSRRPYRVSELQDAYLPLSKRGYPEFGDGKITDKVVERHEIDDGLGNMIPDHPGIVIPLAQLPPDHPAISYMAAREGGPVDLGLLGHMYGAAWCEVEAPEDREIGRFYAKRHRGWKDTPQGRIIFHGYIRGVRRIWQGRYLEAEDESGHFVWHPYEKGWIRDSYRPEPGSALVYVPPFDQPWINGAGPNFGVGHPGGAHVGELAGACRNAHGVLRHRLPRKQRRVRGCYMAACPVAHTSASGYTGALPAGGSVYTLTGLRGTRASAHRDPGTPAGWPRCAGCRCRAVPRTPSGRRGWRRSCAGWTEEAATSRSSSAYRQRPARRGSRRHGVPTLLPDVPTHREVEEHLERAP